VIAPATRRQIGDLFELADLGNQALMKSQFVAFALSLILVSAPAAKAQTDAGTEPCVTWHRCEPGPIVNGHRRQPTPREIEARMWDLLAWSKVSAGACAVAPHNAKTIVMRPPSARSPDRVVESDLPSLPGTQ
jgi:hypothetical protein